MAKSDPETRLKNDEFTRIFDEYRARIDEITKKTEKSLNAEGAADNSVKNEAAKQPEMVPGPQPAPVVPPVEPERPASLESAEIIREARRKAQRIIEEAEAAVKKEAKKKTQSHVEKIISRAQQEAEFVVSKARQEAEAERDNIVAQSQVQAEYALREITETCRQDTQSQSAQIIAEAGDKAKIIVGDVIRSSSEIGRLISEIVDRAKKTVEELETRLKSETAELTNAISETQNMLNQVTRATRQEETLAAVVSLPGENTDSGNKTSGREKEAYESPTLAVHVLGEKSNGSNGSQPLFSGRVEMKSVSNSFDYQYLKNLKKYLVHIPAIKYLQENASEKEMSILFDVQEPLPLIEILSNVPMVDEVVTEAEDICVVFKSSQS